MFGHTGVSSSYQNTTSRFSRSQITSSIRRKDADPVQVRTPSASPQRTRRPSSVQLTHPPAKMSERYANREYDRQPSPTSRFQRPGSSCSRPEDSPRQTTPSRLRLQRAAPSASQRTLESHSSRPDGSPLARPRTADHPQVGRPLSASLCKENRVLLAVKDVLSKAVLERGRIDENNIGTILHDMQTRLNIDDEEDGEPSIPLDLEKKTSRTSVNVNNSSENVLLRKQKPFGFVRRQLEQPMKKASKVYRKIYNDVELPEKRTQSRENFGEEGVIYVDLLDPDYSSFNSMLRMQQEKLKQNEITASRKKSEVAEQQQVAEEVVGDHKSKEKPSEIWRSVEEAKLQQYIEYLMKNMNKQLSGDRTAQKVEDDAKEKTFCKSICVCKVCVSNRTASKRALESQTSQVEIKAVKQSGSKMRSSNISLDVSKARGKSSDKGTTTESSTRMKFKILKKNQNFQPESRVSITSRNVVNKPATNESYTVVDHTMDDEAGEDLYLQRRMNRATSGRRTSRM